MRSCSFVEAPNCSIAQIREGRIFVLGYEIYPVANSEINYSEGQVVFYKVDDRASLNQAVETANLSEKILLLPINLAFEVFNCFKELEQENERKIKDMFTSTN